MWPSELLAPATDRRRAASVSALSGWLVEAGFATSSGGKLMPTESGVSVGTYLG